MVQPTRASDGKRRLARTPTSVPGALRKSAWNPPTLRSRAAQPGLAPRTAEGEQRLPQNGSGKPADARFSRLDFFRPCAPNAHLKDKRTGISGNDQGTQPLLKTCARADQRVAQHRWRLASCSASTGCAQRPRTAMTQLAGLKFHARKMLVHLQLSCKEPTLLTTALLTKIV